MEKILIVDDESRMRTLIRDFLKRDNFAVIEAANGQEALDRFFENPDTALIVLDVMMPIKNGYEVLKEVRASSQVPVIMLTARSDEVDALNGYDFGADDYVTKPFSPKLLVARIKALIRRNEMAAGSSVAEGEHDIIEFGDLKVDQSAHIVTVSDENVNLSVKEFELLVYFMKNAGIALSREQILSSVWDYDYYGDARTIDTHVKKLRAKLGDCGKYITTIWGMGYKFEKR
ncbi:MAG: response regulator transcription factor [Lachnospiraceae bacterium]|nr:response regulator transcription factor [Lachnospiraceae bacterium]